jgi:hypothetical protein
MMEGEGFEPSKSPTTDLQSAPFGRSGIPPYKADDRTRTDNLLITSQLLCQLSHVGILLLYTINDFSFLNYGGRNRARTCDPLLVRQVLSQLSYAPQVKLDVRGLKLDKTTQKGLEPSTSGVTGRRSNQLSHWATNNLHPQNQTLHC